MCMCDRLGMLPATRSTQPGHPFVDGCNKYPVKLGKVTSQVWHCRVSGKSLPDQKPARRGQKPARERSKVRQGNQKASK